MKKENTMNRKTLHFLLPVLAAVLLFGGATVAKAAFRQTSATSSEVIVEWDDPYAGSTSIRTTGYTVSVGSSSTNIVKTLGTATGTAYKIMGITPSSQIYVRVDYTAVGNSGTSYNSYLGGYVSTVPADVTKFYTHHFTSSQKGLYLSWDPGTYADKPHYEYEVYSYKGKKLTTGTSFLYVDGNNKCWGISEYSFPYYKQAVKVRVRPYVDVYSNGTNRFYGNWSKFKNIVPQPILSTNKNKYGIQKNHTLKLGWTKVTGATGYDVYVSLKEKSGYKKAASVKGNKAGVVVKKFKGAKFKYNTTYYIKVVTKTKKLGKSRNDYGVTAKLTYYRY